jgi:hypothetical protein
MQTPYEMRHPDPPASSFSPQGRLASGWRGDFAAVLAAALDDARAYRGGADGVIVSGAGTGQPTARPDLEQALAALKQVLRQSTHWYSSL